MILGRACPARNESVLTEREGQWFGKDIVCNLTGRDREDEVFEHVAGLGEGQREAVRQGESGFRHTAQRNIGGGGNVEISLWRRLPIVNSAHGRVSSIFHVGSKTPITGWPFLVALDFAATGGQVARPTSFLSVIHLLVGYFSMGGSTNMEGEWRTITTVMICTAVEGF